MAFLRICLFGLFHKTRKTVLTQILNISNLVTTNQSFIKKNEYNLWLTIQKVGLRFPSFTWGRDMFEIKVVKFQIVN